MKNNKQMIEAIKEKAKKEFPNVSIKGGEEKGFQNAWNSTVEEKREIWEAGYLACMEDLSNSPFPKETKTINN